MRIRQPWMIRAASGTGAAALRLLLSTLSYRYVAADGAEHPADPDQERFLYLFWHESLLAPARRPARVNVLISYHTDGEIITQICRKLGIGVVRGSTKRRGGQALLELLRCSRDAHLAITPDGPRGPRRRVQAGAIFVASHTGLPIVPLGVGFSRAWRAGSWDRFAVPLPFSRLYGFIGRPIHIPPALDRDGLEHYRRIVEEALLAATAKAEAWAAHPETPPQAEPSTTHRKSA